MGSTIRALRASGGDIVEKKKIRAKNAVADIRSGMSDADLMSKYALSNTGLQSLFDKLVTAGYIDLVEILERAPLFLGTVDISESFSSSETVKAEDRGQPIKTKAETRVNAHEAARDIRSGMDDSALMQKYRLTSKGLSSLFRKLMEVGLIKQTDIDRRNIGFEHTVLLTEDMLSLSAALKSLGLYKTATTDKRGPYRPPVITDEKPISPQSEEPARSVEEKSAVLPDEKPYMRGSDRIEPHHKSLEWRWYDDPSIVMLLLIVLFPLGWYACYRNSTLSYEVKAFAIVACFLLIISCLIMISLMPK
jgi:hypothetical protein